jgi:antitoxin CptB
MMPASHSQLRWQCRRGMRELDELLSRYLETAYNGASAGEKAAFRSLLELPDPDLASYLLQQRRPPPEMEIAIQGILKRTDA